MLFAALHMSPIGTQETVSPAAGGSAYQDAAEASNGRYGTFVREPQGSQSALIAARSVRGFDTVLAHDHAPHLHLLGQEFA
jgi:hypothetical protein